jgi:hypothetical protein
MDSKTEPILHDNFEALKGASDPDGKIEEEEAEEEKDMLLCQSRVLYPEVEEWILSMAVSAYLKQKQLNPDINFRSLNINEECECCS